MIPCALIGLGRIASLLEDDARREKPATHAGAINAHPETFIAAGMDSDPEQRRNFSERWGVEAMYDDAERMIHAVRPRILHICTHADSHLRYLELALQSQVPVVVLEKPVSDSLRKARRMVPRLKMGGTRVVVNHERRYSRDYLKARERILSGRFGPLRSVRAGLFMGKERPLEAILLYDGTHLFDIIAFLIGTPIEYVRRTGGRSRDRSLFVTGRSAGVPILAEIGNGRDHVVFELELSFESGRLRIGNGIYEEWESVDSPYYENMRSLRLIESPPLGKTGYFAGMFADAVRLTKEPEAAAVSSYADGLESLELVGKVRKGLRFRPLSS
jgi:predicted dehydrogenase